MNYIELQLPPRPAYVWPPTNKYQAALDLCAAELRAAGPWLLATQAGGPLLVARRRTWWMRVVTWWLNLHVRAYLRTLDGLKAEAIAAAVRTPNRNGD